MVTTSTCLMYCMLLIFLPWTQSDFATFPRVLDDLATHKDLRQFTQLLRDNEFARRYLHTREVTILAPTDTAFDKYKGRLDNNLIMYLILPIAMSVEGLLEAGKESRTLKTISDNLPFLWPSCTYKPTALHINDALVILNDSNHQSRTRGDIYGKLQIVHKINRVLSPMTIMSRPPTAYDFLSQTSSWPLISNSLNNFLKRVITTNSVDLYKEPLNGHTFLISDDLYRSDLDDLEITQDTIKCAISPLVHFIIDDEEREESLVAIRTLHKNCFLTFSQKTVTVHDAMSGHTKTLRVLKGNVPLRNGVVHVVDHMPGVWKSKMAPHFPIRTLNSHINNDFFLQSTTRLMENLTQIDFQNVRNDIPENFTLFVVRDYNWEKFLQKNDYSIQELLKHPKFERFMMRHLSHGVYDIKRLIDVSKTNLRGETLTLGVGEEKIIAKFVEDDEEDENYERGQVNIVWGTEKLKILRGDIYCSNGMIHIIDGPFIFDNEIKDDRFSLLKLWKVVNKYINH